jgi:hypothetical protein
MRMRGVIMSIVIIVWNLITSEISQSKKLKCILEKLLQQINLLLAVFKVKANVNEKIHQHS